jgi:hypothetical protein
MWTLFILPIVIAVIFPFLLIPEKGTRKFWKSSYSTLND